ncbi:VOC family protein [Taklimakanibacter deserti]|uniref:VOC family protein n=1 Tax=Taklimakanibacter deserti TaxID=2267839 RepID=UPI000E656643
MARHLSLITVLVDDYDQAIEFYVGKLGFSLSEDRQLSPDKRWVVVTPQGGGTGLLLAKAANGRQIAIVGNQGGGRVFLFLETDDFKRDHAAFSERGVRFLEAPREEPYGMVAVFEDLYGNRWDLIEPR